MIGKGYAILRGKWFWVMTRKPEKRFVIKAPVVRVFAAPSFKRALNKTITVNRPG